MSVRTTGLNEILNGFQRAFGGAYVRAQVVTHSTHGTLRFGKKYSKPDARSEVQNLIIFRSQRKEGRDPVFFSGAVQTKGRRMWSEEISKYLRGVGDLKQGAKAVAELMRKTVIDNIDSGKSAGGRMKPLTEWYERIKEANYGKQPILEKTGQLKKSLQIAIKSGGKHGRLFRS